jgi:hypothetical protein
MFKQEKYSNRMKMSAMSLHAVVAAIVCASLICCIGCSEPPGSPTGPADVRTTLNGSVSARVDRLDVGSFTFEAKYDSIRAYGGGGGVFIVRIDPGPDFQGEVTLSVKADKKMRAELTRKSLTSANPVTELLIKPTRSVDSDFYCT